LFAKLLDDQIPFGTRILECGCGTGQLTNFLSVAMRTVIGTDICFNSLKMAQEFKNNNGLERAHFYQMNLFRPCFKPQSFDLVISNGVLHHTSDPFLAFKSISALVRPQGYVLIGLYHKYGRIITDLRRLVFKMAKDKFKFLDRRAVDEDISRAKRDSWFMDQYKNPHESKHTVGEVLHWLDKTGFIFMHSIPKTVPFAGIGESERLFNPDKLGNWFERFLVNIGMIVAGHREGGFFVIIAKKSKVSFVANKALT
jgi:SAM-dependent methyltransferase